MSIQSNFPNLKPSLLLDFANTKQLDNRVTFTRSTPAVYYDGKTTAMAEQNLLLQSQTFGTTWGVNSASITSDTTTAPDGTTTADTLTSTGTDACLAYQAKPTSTAGTISCYIKKGTSNFAYMYVDNPSLTGNAAIFDINTGVVGSYSSTFTSTSIVSVGNGWYRCIATFTGISGTNIGIGVCDTSSTTTCTSGRTIYLWGAQLEQRSSATAYTPTTTQAITNYIPVLLTAGGNQPRFDCNPTTGESLGLLIEEQRTNLNTYSSAFNSWTSSGMTVAADAVVAPDGTISADLFTNTSTASYVNNLIGTATGGQNYTYSVYVKQGTATYLQMGVSNAGASYAFIAMQWSNLAITNLNSGSASVVSSSVTAVGNGWYRVSVTIVYSSNSTFYTYLSGASSTSILNCTVGQTLIAWGAQLEAGSFATSYIPTTSASATRTADSASMTGTNFSSWYRQDQGTLYAETRALSDTAQSVYNGLSIATTGANSSTMDLLVDTRGSGSTNLYVFNNGSSTGTVGIAQPVLNIWNKIAAGYAVNNVAMATNGTLSSSATNTVIPLGTELKFGYYSLAVGIFNNGYLRKFAYYPLRVSNTNLQALTS